MLNVNSKMVQAIFFDVGNTLVRMNYSAVREQLVLLGIDRTQDEIISAEYLARVELDQYLSLAPPDRLYTVAEFYFGLWLKGLEIHETEIHAAMTQWRRSYNSPIGLWNQVDGEAEASLRRIRTQGLITGVISNSNGYINHILRELGLDKFLDIIIDSHLVGFEKPDSRIFQLALNIAGVQARETIYIGDLYSVDILGARKAGMRGILLDPGGIWEQSDNMRAPSLNAAVSLALEVCDE